jgi:hypothetical protein
MECKSPAAPLTVCDFGIVGVDVVVVGAGVGVMLGSAEAALGCEACLGGIADCLSFSR